MTVLRQTLFFLYILCGPFLLFWEKDTKIRIGGKLSWNRRHRLLFKREKRGEEEESHVVQYHF